MTMHVNFSLRLTATEQQCLAKACADASAPRVEEAAVLLVDEMTFIHDNARELWSSIHRNYTIQYVQYVCGYVRTRKLTNSGMGRQQIFWLNNLCFSVHLVHGISHVLCCGTATLEGIVGDA